VAEQKSETLLAPPDRGANRHSQSFFNYYLLCEWTASLTFVALIENAYAVTLRLTVKLAADINHIVGVSQAIFRRSVTKSGTG
jgi:hypothetical protein